MPILWAWNVFGWSRWAPNIGRKCSCSAWIRSRRLTKLVNCAFRTNWSRIVEKMLLGLHGYVERKWENFSEVEFSKSRFGIIGFNRPDSRFLLEKISSVDVESTFVQISAFPFYGPAVSSEIVAPCPPFMSRTGICSKEKVGGVGVEVNLWDRICILWAWDAFLLGVCIGALDGGNRKKWAKYPHIRFFVPQT